MKIRINIYSLFVYIYVSLEIPNIVDIIFDYWKQNGTSFFTLKRSVM